MSSRSRNTLTGETGGRLWSAYLLKSSVATYLAVVGEQARSSLTSNEEADDENMNYQEKVDALVAEKNWDLILGMQAARWYSEIVAEKTLILVAAFFVWLFDLADMPHMKLLRIMMIFFSGEFVADLTVIFSLERWFGIPFSRLPGYKSKKDFFEGVLITSLEMAGLATGIMIVDEFIKAKLK